VSKLATFGFVLAGILAGAWLGLILLRSLVPRGEFGQLDPRR
jgi:hypothetical protein